MPVLVEVAIGSVEDARVAAEAGADRLELNAALELGGLTPSIGMVESVREAVSLPLFVMIRPRSGGFAYDRAEVAVMTRDLRRIAPFADGFVFGSLDQHGRVDLDANRRLLDAADGRPCVFHRAFDIIPEPFEALETLIGLGFRRVLTSGQAADAPSGSAMITRLIAHAAGRIEIIPGAGIRPGNAAALVRATGCDQIHGSFGTTRPEPAPTSGIRFGSDPSSGANGHRVADGAAIRAVIAELDALGPSQHGMV